MSVVPGRWGHEGTVTTRPGKYRTTAKDQDIPIDIVEYHKFFSHAGQSWVQRRSCMLELEVSTHT
jgi:hypothetical protein